MINLSQYNNLVYEIIGAAMIVHTELGWGLAEAIYNEALHLELLERGIKNETEKPLHCYYKKQLLEKRYQMDIVVGNEIILELKFVNELVSSHRYQLFNYLRLTKYPIGILINFGQSGLQGERYAYDVKTNEYILLDRNMQPVY